jgi:hypothetical protein
MSPTEQAARPKKGKIRRLWEALVDLFYVFAIAVIGGTVALALPGVVEKKCSADSRCAFMRVIIPEQVQKVPSSEMPSSGKANCVGRDDASLIFRLSARLLGLDDAHAPYREFLDSLSLGSPNSCPSLTNVATKTCELLRSRSFAAPNACSQMNQSSVQK